MLINNKKKALVLRLREPERVTSVIPGAKLFEYNGKQYVAVKHGVDEVKVLRNLGFQAPSPILHQYDWPGRFKPFFAQREVAAFLTMHHRAFNLSEIGTGKTMAALWAYDYLRSKGKATKMLVVAPLSTLERTWADEIWQHFPHLNAVVVHASSADRRLALLAQDADVYIVNHDGLKVSGVVQALAKRPDIDVVVVDEISQAARNASTDRYKMLHTVINRQMPRRAWGLTGTPIPNGPIDAWAQCRLLVPERVPAFKRVFQEAVMRQVSNFIWVPRDGALKIVEEAMQPAIRFSRDECVDLPECTFVSREVELTATQKKAYKEMMTKLRAEVAAGEVTAVNDAVKANKLIQICAGALYGEDREILEVDAKPRLDVVLEVIEEAGTKVIVFVPFVSSIELVSSYLRKHGLTVECVHGEVSKHERDRIFQAFQRTATPRVLVAIPGAMSHGLTLTAASTVVWYAPITSNDTFVQANGRITRPGQTQKQLIVMIEGSDIERKYYSRLRLKQKVQGTLLDAIKDSREMA